MQSENKLPILKVKYFPVKEGQLYTEFSTELLQSEFNALTETG